MRFDDHFREQLHSLFLWRRDVRRFRAAALPDGALDRLLAVAALAPSVGLSQPWRFVIVENPARLRAIQALYEECNKDALASYTGERAARYAGLKLAGLREAPAQFSVFADHETEQGHGLGRRTMPETIDYSAVTAIHTVWLAARAEGVGLGWVSILDPAQMTAILDVPPQWRFLGHFCMGYPEEEADAPELERAGWEKRRPAPDAVLRR